MHDEICGPKDNRYLMERFLGIVVLSLCWFSLHQNGESQATNDVAGQIEQFTAVESSRLRALADLGRDHEIQASGRGW